LPEQAKQMAETVILPLYCCGTAECGSRSYLRDFTSAQSLARTLGHLRDKSALLQIKHP
jgi:hypothetical protein